MFGKSLGGYELKENKKQWKDLNPVAEFLEVCANATIPRWEDALLLANAPAVPQLEVESSDTLDVEPITFPHQPPESAYLSWNLKDVMMLMKCLSRGGRWEEACNILGKLHTKHSTSGTLMNQLPWLQVDAYAIKACRTAKKLAAGAAVASKCLAVLSNIKSASISSVSTNVAAAAPKALQHLKNEILELALLPCSSVGEQNAREWKRMEELGRQAIDCIDNFVQSAFPSSVASAQLHYSSAVTLKRFAKRYSLSLMKHDSANRSDEENKLGNAPAKQQPTGSVPFLNENKKMTALLDRCSNGNREDVSQQVLRIFESIPTNARPLISYHLAMRAHTVACDPAGVKSVLNELLEKRGGTLQLSRSTVQHIAAAAAATSSQELARFIFAEADRFREKLSVSAAMNAATILVRNIWQEENLQLLRSALDNGQRNSIPVFFEPKVVGLIAVAMCRIAAKKPATKQRQTLREALRWIKASATFVVKEGRDIGVVSRCYVSAVIAMRMMSEQRLALQFIKSRRKKRMIDKKTFISCVEELALSRSFPEDLYSEICALLEKSQTWK